MTDLGVYMKKMLLAMLVLIVTACGGTDTATDPDVEDATAETTVASSADDTASTVTTAGTTTTVETTTTVPTDRGTASADLEAFRAAAADSAAFTSGRFEATMMLAGQPDLPEGFTLYVDGAFNGTLVELRMDMSEALEGAAGTEGFDLGTLGDFSDVRFIFDGETAYMRFPVFALMGVETDWVELPADDAIDTAGFAGIGDSTPVDGLAAYLEAGGDVETVGTERIRGVDTTHFQVLFDVEDFEEFVGDASVADLRASGIEQLPMDVWIGEDGLVYRYAISYEGLEEVDLLSIVYDIFDYGEDVGIELPDPDNVTSMDGLLP